ncbi:unnamed protein product, partial [Closterium sp. NIES-53]
VVGAGGAAAGGTRSGGALLRGAGVGGAGTGGASSGGARAGGAGTSGASSGGAGARGAGAGGGSGVAGAGGTGTGGASSEETGAGGTTTTPPHCRDTRLQAARRPGAAGAAAATAATATAAATAAATAPTTTTDVGAPSGVAVVPAIWSSPRSTSPPIVPHYCVRPCPPRARFSSPVTDLCTALLCLSCCRSPPVSVLPSPPLSSLPVAPTPISEYYRATRPAVSRVLASLVADPRASLSSVSALTAAVCEFDVTRRLDYTTRVVATPPPRHLSVGGEFALGYDVLEVRQFELEFLVAASPSLCAMLLSPEGDSDALDILTPRTYCEAVLGEWASQWKAPMDAELASWRSTGTYVDAVPPPRANIVDGMWLFKVKRPPGSPPVFKAHYVARGFSQREGVDFFQTFAPTPEMTTLRVLLHVAKQRDYALHSLNFSTAFLQGHLHEEIWPRRPPGFTDTFSPGTQWSLRRPVYGLRQSPREWHDTLCSTLRDLGFCPSSADPPLFVHAGSTPFFILVYVDELVFATADRAALAEVKSELQKRHTCSDLVELLCYLGLQITRNRAARIITITQSHMVQEVLQRFKFQFSTTQPTPLAVDHRLIGPFPDEPFESSGPYAELVGCLIYLMTCTRPDLAFPLSVLSWFVVTGRHHPVHWTAAVRVAKYVATTSGMGLVLGGTQPIELC